MTTLHTVGILSTSFIRIVFPTVLKKFPHMLSTSWLLFLHSAVQLIPNHLNWVEIGWLWRPGHLMQHSITFLLGQRCVLGQGVFSPTKHRPDGMADRCRMLWQPCWLSVPWIRNKSLSPAKHPHTITPPPPCFTVGTTHAEIIRSPTPRLTKTPWLEPKISNLNSSDQRTDFHTSNVHCSCFLAQASLFFLLASFSSGFFAEIWPWRTDSRSLLWTVDVEMCLLLELCEAWSCNLRLVTNDPLQQS